MQTNLFFAALPEPDTRLAIAALSRRLTAAHGLRGTPVEAGRLHVTLASARAPQLSLQEAIWRAQMLALEVYAAPCAAHFDFSGSFRGRDRHPFVLRSSGLPELVAVRDRLCQAMRRSGFAVSSGFTPHMTLCWADRCVEDYPIAPIAWQVSDFVLVLSAEGDHIQLGRWRLTL